MATFLKPQRGERHPLGVTTRERADELLKELPEERVPAAREALEAVIWRARGRTPRLRRSLPDTARRG